MRSNVFYCATAMDGVNVMNAWAGGREREPMLAENLARLVKSHEKAVRRAQADSELMRTLPRRAVVFEDHHLRENPWLPYRTVSFPLRDFAPRIDRKTLFALNWKFGGSVSRERQGETPEKLDALFDEWIGHADHESWIRPMGVFGVFPCQSDGDTVILHHPENPGEELCRVAFDVVIGAGRKDVVSGAQYFHPAGSGRYDAIGLQLATSGPQVDAQINRFREDGDSEACLYLQGLSDRVAEDMAEHLHGLLREHMGVDPKQGIRWSPGYPAISDTAYNQTILDLLHASDLIGVRITEAGEFAPTGTTAALVSFHPDARYT
jgi:5-methyltetrahydrofolate--homocysteine methyltransferase